LKPIGRQYSEQPRLPETTTGQNNHGFKDTFRKLPFIVRLAIYCISIYIAFWFGLWVMIAVLVAIVFVLALFDIALQPAKYRKIE
jgi:Flp pilus assembly protein TadB